MCVFVLMGLYLAAIGDEECKSNHRSSWTFPGQRGQSAETIDVEAGNNKTNNNKTKGAVCWL